ncbi:hypothetical protein [Corynebacterium sp. LaCa116]|uniref:hypothetical protein n=1 Tax=Corynebacterium sp. LaCa116 TaxID=3391423 RepID=UPI00398A4F92
MTDLSTTNLKRLLDEAAPGPWHVWDAYEDEDYRPDTALQLHGVDGEYLGLMHLHNPYLAALAPELADEVLRMRRELTHMVEDLNSIHDNPNHSDMECLFALFAAMRLRSIIGHDNLGDPDD